MLMTFLGIVTTIAAAVLLIFMAVAIKKAGVKLPALSNSADKIAGRTAEIVKISLAGTIFLVFLYLLIPNFVAAHHKEIAIIVVAMIVSAILLGIKQEWEKSSTRKILKAHFIVLSIVVVSIVIYKDLETTKWMEESKKEKTKSVWSYTLKTDEKIFTDVIIGKGVNLKFHSSAPFYVISGQKNGTTKKYLIPAGESSWIGNDPRGLLTLEGKKTQKETEINIVLY